MFWSSGLWFDWPMTGSCAFFDTAGSGTAWIRNGIEMHLKGCGRVVKRRGVTVATDHHKTIRMVQPLINQRDG